jgi:hypothetical protein
MPKKESYGLQALCVVPAIVQLVENAGKAWLVSRVRFDGVNLLIPRCCVGRWFVNIGAVDGECRVGMAM